MKITLSKSSLKDLERKLRDTSKQIQAAPNKIVDKLLEIGEAEAEGNILTGWDADGNEDIYVESVKVIGGGKLNMNGDDVAYQEFGYGLPGGGHPKQPPEYQLGTRPRWPYSYWEGNKRITRWSFGMEAQMPMYKASKAMREALPEVVKEETEKCLTSLRK